MPPYNFVSNIRYLFNPKKALYNHPWVTVSCYLGAASVAFAAAMEPSMVDDCPDRPGFMDTALSAPKSFLKPQFLSDDDVLARYILTHPTEARLGIFEPTPAFLRSVERHDLEAMKRFSQEKNAEEGEAPFFEEGHFYDAQKVKHFQALALE